MRSLTWYVTKQILGIALLATVVLCFMVWTFRALDIMDIVFNRGLPLSKFLYFASLQVPRFILFVTPIAALGATLFSYNKLITDSELPVMWAAGLSPIQLSKPAIVVGVATTALSYALSLYLVPATMREFKDLQFKFRNDLPKILLEEGVFVNISEGITVFFEDIGEDGELKHLIVHDNRDKTAPRTYLAETATLLEPKEGKWLARLSGSSMQQLQRAQAKPCVLLSNGTVENPACNLPRFEFFVGDRTENVGLDLGGTEATRGGGRAMRELFVHELIVEWLEHSTDDRDLIDNLKEQNSARLASITTEIHDRMSRPLLAMTGALLGVTVLLLGPFSRRGQLKLILLTIALGGFVIIFSHVLRNYGPRFPILNVGLYVNAILPSVICFAILTRGRILRREIWRTT